MTDQLNSDSMELTKARQTKDRPNGLTDPTAGPVGIRDPM